MMNRYTITGSAFLAISVLTLIISIIRGEMEFYLVLIIPVLVIKGLFGITSVSTFILGIVLLFIGKHIMGRKEEGRMVSEGDIGGIAFIGPIPIVFGTKGVRSRYPSWKYLLIIGIVLFISLNLMLFLLAVVLWCARLTWRDSAEMTSVGSALPVCRQAEKMEGRT